MSDDPMTDIHYMNGLSCLCCGKGWYDGYTEDGEKTYPCQKCGHQAPAMMTRRQILDAYEARDAKE